MMNEVVFTFYGHGETIDKIAATIFAASECQGECKKASNAAVCCHTMNSQRLEGDSWVFAKIVSENEPYSLNSVSRVDIDILLKLEDWSIKEILREVDMQDLAKVLKGESENVRDMVFRNMTNDGAEELEMAIKGMGRVPKSEVREIKKEIIAIYRRMAGTGDLTFKDDIVNAEEAADDTGEDGSQPPLRLIKQEEDPESQE